jgi:DNA replication protein DnaD
MNVDDVIMTIEKYRRKTVMQLTQVQSQSMIQYHMGKLEAYDEILKICGVLPEVE